MKLSYNYAILVAHCVELTRNAMQAYKIANHIEDEEDQLHTALQLGLLHVGLTFDESSESYKKLYEQVKQNM